MSSFVLSGERVRQKRASKNKRELRERVLLEDVDELEENVRVIREERVNDGFLHSGDGLCVTENGNAKERGSLQTVKRGPRDSREKSIDDVSFEENFRRQERKEHERGGEVFSFGGLEAFQEKRKKAMKKRVVHRRPRDDF